MLRHNEILSLIQWHIILINHQSKMLLRSAFVASLLYLTITITSYIFFFSFLCTFNVLSFPYFYHMLEFFSSVYAWMALRNLHVYPFTKIVFLNVSQGFFCCCYLKSATMVLYLVMNNCLLACDESQCKHQPGTSKSFHIKICRAYMTAGENDCLLGDSSVPKQLL